MPEDFLTPAIESSIAAARESGVIEDAPVEDQNTDDATPVEAKEETPAEVKTEESKEPVVEETDEQKAEKAEKSELDSIKKELLEKTPGLDKGRIRVVDHQAVLTRTRRQHEAAVKELNTKLAGYEAEETQNRIRGAMLAENRPDVFVKHVLMEDPRYKQIFDSMVEEAVAKRGAAPAPKTGEATPAASTAPVELPKPDALLPDGTLGYTAETQQKVIEYYLAKEREAHTAEMTKLREELKPVTSRAEAEKNLQAAFDRQKPILENARANWPEFTENQDAIKALMADDLKKGEAAWASGLPYKLMDLHTAYNKVLYDKLKAGATLTEAEKAKIRAEERAAIAKEQNKSPRPKSNSLTPGHLPAATNGDPNESVPLEDVIRGAMRQANL